ncbi:phage scaffolding protein [Weissella tructae]
MDFKELLTGNELTEEQVAKVIADMTENGIYITSEQDADTRLSKMKEQRDKARADLTAKEEEVTELTATIAERDETISKHVENESSIEELRAELEEANNGRTKLERSQKLDALLRKAGATDTEYMAYKLGGVDGLEVDDEGSFTGIDERLNELKEQHPKYFGGDKPANGYEVLDNKLEDGNSPDSDPFTTAMEKYK